MTGITNFTADNLIVQTFLSNENEANSSVIFTGRLIKFTAL